MGNTQVTQYARFIDGTKEEGYSPYLVNILNEDPNVLSGPMDGIDTVVDAFQRTAKELPHNEFLGWRDQTQEDAPYIWRTWLQSKDYVDNLARGIKAFDMMEDIEAEGRTWNFMGIYGKNRPEWVLTDLASATLGGTTVAFYDTLGPAAIEFVIKQTKLTTITCTSAQLSQLILLKTQGKAESIKFLICMDDYDYSVQQDGKEAGLTIFHIDEVVAHGRKHQKMDLEQFRPKTDDIYMFCYTSGTTGDPKAAMLSHKNLLSAASAAMQVQGISVDPDEDCIISYLPLAHSFEKVLFTMCLMTGVRIGYYSGDPLKLLDDLKVLSPTFFPSVPRLFNRVYDKIQAGIKEKSPMQQALVNRAVETKLHYLKYGGYYTHSLWDNAVFGKFKVLLGGRVRIMVTGSAPINPDVLNFLKVCFCAPIHEGYGQTESCAASCITNALDPEAGHVGGPLTCIRIRLRDIPEMQYMSSDPNPRGEICYQGPSIFHGYFKNKEKTQEALSKDGWLASGDVGMVLPNGSIKIIDRAKNIFKLAQGEYIAPEKLENVYTQCPYIAQIFVHGESTEAWLMAVCVVEKPEIKKLALAQEWIKEGDDLKDILAKPELHQAIIANFNDLAKTNKLSGLEKIKKIHLIDEPFSVENDLLTPTFKIKRNIAKNVYKDVITAIYKSGPN